MPQCQLVLQTTCSRTRIGLRAPETDRVLLGFSRWSVRAQLMLLVAAVLLPALLALGLFFIHERAESLTHAYERVALLSRNSSLDLGEMLRDHEAVLGRMAQRPLVKALDARQCDPIIGEYTQLHPAYTNLVVRDLSGRNDCSALARKLAPGQQAVDLVPGYLEAQRRDGLTVGAAHLGPLSGRWVSVLFYPVKDAQNKVSGLISLPMNLLALSERYLGTVAPDDLVLVVDASGRIVMRSRDGGEWVGKPVPETLLLGAAATQGGPFSAPGIDSVARYWAVAPVAGVDWRVLAGVPVEQVMAAPNRALGVGLALVLACLAAALLAAWRVSLGLVRPIGVLSQVVEQVAGGQTALRVPPQTGPKEIAAVAEAFNDMLDAREQAQQSLASSEERFRMLTALSADWYWEQDAQYRCIRINGQDRDGTGTRVEDYLGKTQWELPALNLSEADWERHRAVLQARQEYRNFEIQRVGADGQVGWVSISATPMYDAAGQFCGYRGVGTNITERKLQEQRRLTLTERVEELSRGLVQAQEETRRRFASELHDRTSPNLAALRINLAMIAAATPEARLTSAFAHRIEDTRALIDDTNASIRDICAELHPAALEMGGLLAAVQSYAQQMAARTGLKVVVQCPHGEARLAAALELSLFRIVQEAMTNCAKHARATTVSVRLLFAAEPIRVAVSDDGVGFDAERVLRVASRSGLGLLNMRETAEFVGGRLSIESVPGRGTQVLVEIDPSFGVASS